MSTVDDTDTGSVNSDDFLEPGLCDFEEFYECEDGSLASDDDSFYDADDDVPPKLIQRGKEAGCESNFPPPLKDYKPRDPSRHPIVGFNEGREKVWEQGMKEVDLLRARVGIKGEGRQGLFEIEFGEDSELYAKCKKIGIESLEQYYKWLATFFLECRFSVTYERLVKDPDVNTSSYMDLDEYKAIWRKMDNYNKKNNYSSRSWEEIETALNETLHDLFVPKQDEFKMRLSYDDDKHWFNFFVKVKDMLLGVDSKLKRERHVRDNVVGMTADVASNNQLLDFLSMCGIVGRVSKVRLLSNR